ncbi:MAG: transglutaminase TgpA family protein [Ilumatobacteraceae bacterium]
MSADAEHRDTRPAATLCLSLLTAVTVVGLCRIFRGWDFLQPMLVLAFGMHLLAYVFRAVRLPLWAAAPAMLLSLFVMLGIVYYRDTLTALLPTGRTIDQFRTDLRLVLDQFPTAVAPVPGEGSFATATAGIVGLCVILSDTFAFRAMGRIEAVVPTGVLFVFTSALGTDRNRVIAAALWIAAAVLTVAVLRFSDAEQEGGWMGSRRVRLAAALPAIIAVVAVSGVAAYAVGPRLPGADESSLIDFRHRDGNKTLVLNPIVSIRDKLVKQSNREVFSVRSSDKGHYWRVTALPVYDGEEWKPGQEDIAEVGDRTGEVLISGVRVTQTFTFKQEASNLLPAAYQVVRVSGNDGVKWVMDSQGLVMAGQKTTKKGTTVQVESVVAEPSPDLLRAATVAGADPTFLELPDDVPEVARTTADAVTAAASTPYDKALALQNWFRDNFTYSTDFQAGSSTDAITEFLRGKLGFCQQFAGTFAVMARHLQLPARVAVGYTPGDLGTDGQYHVRGRHAHAWPEVWFDGIGWVAFEPTPQRGNPDATGYTDVAPQQAGPNDGNTNNTSNTSANTASTTTTPGASTPSTTATGNTRPGEGVGPGRGSTTTEFGGAAPKQQGGSWIVPLVIATLVIAFVLWLLLAPRVIAALQRRRFRTPRERIIAAWHRACHALALAGAPPVAGATPMEYAQRADASTGAGDSLRELAQTVTVSVYSTFEPTDRQARRAEALEHEVDLRCRTLTPWRLRLRNSFDPAMLRRRVSG